ncbi:hypothetical protein [Sandaracinus amylolyticus]|uniref:Uncharacterized protein n=1 Tax=Sandaracinus amylolyticus TaxID=927083 RepID=A0A0F6W2Z0_9BACT|nr:hypothetical protein [Sandaracinus amylolyticus]AKF06067.1 hypothetical protein DB32_003216 [Sandaracinus amylolyticus]
MIVVLRRVGASDVRVILPAAPVAGDVLEMLGGTWRVTGRRFAAPMDGEADLVVRVEPVQAPPVQQS